MRLLTLASTAGLLVASGIVIGCAAQGDTLPEENTRSRSDGIVGGTIDPGNDAVVLYINGSGQCTATIVAKNGSTGYALTAAHCIGAQLGQLLQADDYEDCFQGNAGCQAVYNVNEVSIHPNYTGNASEGYDFAMLRFGGAGASTPVIPAAQSPDGLAAGSQVEFVGYGVNEFNDTNRRHVFDTLSAIPSIGVNNAVDPLWIWYDENPGGPCSGDSGGPALRGGEVVGVTSFGDQNCSQYGASGRVSTVYNSFIKPYIDGAPPVLNCDDCFQSAISGAGACVPSVDACFNDTNCAGLVDCLNNCGANDNSCIQGCANQWSAGIGLYNAIFDCTCSVCASECAAECSDPNPTATGTGVDTGTGTGTSTDTNLGTGTDTNLGTDTGTGTGTGSNKKKKSGGGDADDDSGCAIAAPGTDSDSGLGAAWIALVGLMAGAAGLRRRRRSPK